VALEGALKLKEISYIHAEGYPAAEMKHGPIALIDSDMPVVVIATHNGMYEKVISNIQEVKARKGKVIAIVSEGDTTISKIADEVIALPDTIECLEPLLAIWNRCWPLFLFSCWPITLPFAKVSMLTNQETLLRVLPLNEIKGDSLLTFRPSF